MNPHKFVFDMSQSTRFIYSYIIGFLRFYMLCGDFEFTILKDPQPFCHESNPNCDEH